MNKLSKNNFRNAAAKTIAVTMIAITIVAPFSTVQAQFGGGGGGGGGQNVPIGTDTDFNITMQHVKDYVTDKLAYEVAGRLLQQITDSVVNWINSGFEGNPSFLDNPEAFFMDAADQITGAFIANTGMLSKLCSPFGLDIRLSLALGQSQSTGQQRYACTLSTIVNNARNAGASVSVGTSPNGATIGDFANGNILGSSEQLSVNGQSVDATGEFLAGNFSQGGWPAFIALTTEPQNNPTGAYLMAQSDLQERIAAKENAINKDLDRGNGFMSWKKCDTVTTVSAEDAEDREENYLSSYSSDPRYSLKTNSDGSTDVQTCETQTPGSVISGSLEKSLGVSQDRLNMADSINKIANALFSQLVNRVLGNGLLSAGGRASGGNATAEAVAQLEAERVAAAKRDLSNAIDQFEISSGLSAALSLRQQAINDITAARLEYQSAKLCFAQINTSNRNDDYIQSQMAAIDTAVATKIDPLETTHQQKLTTARQALAVTTNLRQNILSATTLDQINSYSQQLNALSVGGNNQGGVTAAQNDLDSLSTELETLSREAAQYQQSCAQARYVY